MKKTILNDFNKLLYFVIVLTVLIFFIMGFLIGYILTDKSCSKNPFRYGIKEINKGYGEDLKLTCSCYSLDNNVIPFSFDKEGIK